MQSEEATVVIAESNPSPDGWRAQVLEDLRARCAERAKLARHERVEDAERRMLTEVGRALDQYKTPCEHEKENESPGDKVTWWRPEPVFACACVSTFLKAPVGI